MRGESVPQRFPPGFRGGRRRTCRTGLRLTGTAGRRVPVPPGRKCDNSLPNPGRDTHLAQPLVSRTHIHHATIAQLNDPNNKVCRPAEARPYLRRSALPPIKSRPITLDKPECEAYIHTKEEGTGAGGHSGSAARLSPPPPPYTPRRSSASPGGAKRRSAVFGRCRKPCQA